MDDDRERVNAIVAFHEACPCPTPDEVAAWAARFPRWADDLRFHADAALDEARELRDGLEPSAELLMRTRTVALEILAAASGRAAGARPLSLDGLAKRAGIDLPALARALSIGRALLVDLFQGRIAAPVPKALLSALADALRTSMDAVAAAVENAQPRMGRAKAFSAPSARRRDLADAVRDDPGMTPGQKASWLERIGE